MEPFTFVVPKAGVYGCYCPCTLRAQWTARSRRTSDVHHRKEERTWQRRRSIRSRRPPRATRSSCTKSRTRRLRDPREGAWPAVGCAGRRCDDLSPATRYLGGPPASGQAIVDQAGLRNAPGPGFAMTSRAAISPPHSEHTSCGRMSCPHALCSRTIGGPLGSATYLSPHRTKETRIG